MPYNIDHFGLKETDLHSRVLCLCPLIFLRCLLIRDHHVGDADLAAAVRGHDVLPGVLALLDLDLDLQPPVSEKLLIRPWII